MTTKAASLEGIGYFDSRVVANNTFRYRLEEGHTIYRLHYTDIVTYLPNDTGIVLNSGGWRTVTTKDRMNRYLPHGINIYADTGVWRICSGNNWDVLYEDGMTIPPDLSKPRILYEKRKVKWFRMRQKEIKAYTVKMRDKGYGEPSPGDCWICMAEPGMEFRDSKRDPRRNNHHILEHLREKYVHGHLVYNAMKWAGYRDEQMPYVYGMKRIAISCVRRYLKARVGLNP